MNPSKAKSIIQNVVETTQPRWSQYSESWNNVDILFIIRGYEQSGFELFKMKPLLQENGILSIDSLGEIMTRHSASTSYHRDYAGSITAEFYLGLLNGLGGIEGKLFAETIQIFLNHKIGKPGRFFWRLLYQMLQACTFLKEKYSSSFAKYIIDNYIYYTREKLFTEKDFLNISISNWEKFLAETKPWTNLKGIGPNVFDFIIGDITEALYVKNSFKFDSANQYFFKVTGISSLIKPFDKETTCMFLKDLGFSFSLREINKGIYTYCSITEAKNFGFCRSYNKCNICKENFNCEKHIN